MNIKEQVFGELGYSTDLCLSDTELAFFRGAIREQWLARISELYPNLVESLAFEDISNYHHWSSKVDHEALWHKKYRLFTKEVVNEIKNFGFIANLRAAFGSFSISHVVFDNAVTEGVEEIYWRLVRPGVATDIGPLHADKWFHNLVGGTDYGMFPEGTTTVKIWIPIYVEPGLNGLLVVPGSHKKDWAYTAIEKNGQIKPCIQEDVDSLNVLLVPTKPGNCLIFNEKILHGGALNQGKHTRVSIEITMVLN